MDKKLTEIYTSLNNQRLQEYPLNLAKSEDYLFNEANFEDSCILSSNIYKYNWIHWDNFGNSNLTNGDLTEPQGISLAEEKTFWRARDSTQERDTHPRIPSYSAW